LNEPKEPMAYLDFGWANGWAKEPEMVIACKKAGHKTIKINRDPSWHGFHTEVRCDICHYIYHYDSSG